jgi:hypothetical protein
VARRVAVAEEEGPEASTRGLLDEVVDGTGEKVVLHLAPGVELEEQPVAPGRADVGRWSRPAR